MRSSWLGIYLKVMNLNKEKKKWLRVQVVLNIRKIKKEQTDQRNGKDIFQNPKHLNSLAHFKLFALFTSNFVYPSVLPSMIIFRSD